MARFAFAFSNSTILRPTLTSVAQLGLVVLANGDVVVNSLSQPWTLHAERLESGEISVTGGNGSSIFRYSTDSGATWNIDVSPALIFEQGEVLFEAIGTTESAGGIAGSSIGVLPDGDLIVYKLASVWELTATRTVGFDIEVTGGPVGAQFRYSIDAGTTWTVATSPTTISQGEEVIFEPLGSVITIGGEPVETARLAFNSAFNSQYLLLLEDF